jgi:hypothetical protein
LPSFNVFHTNKSLFAAYNTLQAEDIVVGRLRLRATEEALIADLISRGVRLIPSGISQLASRSKVLQAILFGQEFMMPGTHPVHDLHDMQKALIEFGKNSDVSSFITKLDRKNAGIGICKWASLEDVYTAALLKSLPFPFVIQPYLKDCKDVRVIILGSHYAEAYERKNAGNFRNNLHFGGRSCPFTLSPSMHTFCRRVMQRGQFPYAHIDLLMTPDGHFYLNEINLKGGMRGATLDKATYSLLINAIHQEELDRHLPQAGSC